MKLMDVFYENIDGEKLDLLSDAFHVYEADWFTSEWGTSKDGYERTIKFDVFKTADHSFRENMERLYKHFAVDAEAGQYGKLYVNGTYLFCNILKSEKENWHGYIYAEVKMKVYAPALEWISEKTVDFHSFAGVVSTDLDHSWDYPHDYKAQTTGTVLLNIDHPAASDFEMVIFGPVANPTVLINGHPYTMNLSLSDGDFCTIDSRLHKITWHKASGVQENAFNYRGITYSVFELIPRGDVPVSWDGSFSFRLTLFLKRREPAW